MRGDGVKMAALLAAAAVVGAGLVLAGARAAQPLAEAPQAPAPVRIVVLWAPAPPATPPAARDTADAGPAAAVVATKPGMEAKRPAQVVKPARPSPGPVARAVAPATGTTKSKRAGKPRAVAVTGEGPGAVAKPSRAPGQSGRRLSPEVVARLRAPTGEHSEEVRRLLERAGRLLERGARWEAMAVYARLLKAHPGDADALMGVALCRFELGERAKARRLLDRLLARTPSHGPAAILRGFLEQLAGRRASAVAWYQRALTHLDEDPALSDELRQVVASLGGDATQSLAEAR